MLVDLVLAKKKVCVIGGGNVALRKIKQFLQEDAHVYVITKELNRKEIQTLVSDIVIQPFSFAYFQEDTDLVYVAIDDKKESMHIVQEMQKKKILCGCSIPSASISYHSVAQQKKEQMEFAISAKGCPGAIPGYFQQMQPILETIAEKNEILKELRKTWIAHQMQSQTIKELLQELSLWNVHYLRKLQKTNGLIIVCIYHGIAALDQIIDHLYAYEKRLEHKANVCAMSIFLSDKICHKANRSGYGMPTWQQLQNVLQKLHLSYRIQPMLLWEGYHHTRLQKLCHAHLCARPLICDQADVKRLDQILQKYQKYDTSIVIYHEQDSFTKLSLPTHFYAIHEVDRELPEGDQIDIFPLFLCCGYHSKKDIQTIWMPKLYRRYEQVHLHTHLLPMEEIQEWYLQRLLDNDKKSME